MAILQDTYTHSRGGLGVVSLYGARGGSHVAEMVLRPSKGLK